MLSRGPMKLTPLSLHITPELTGETLRSRKYPSQNRVSGAFTLRCFWANHASPSVLCLSFTVSGSTVKLHFYVPFYELHFVSVNKRCWINYVCAAVTNDTRKAPSMMKNLLGFRPSEGSAHSRLDLHTWVEQSGGRRVRHRDIFPVCGLASCSNSMRELKNRRKTLLWRTLSPIRKNVKMDQTESLPLMLVCCFVTFPQRTRFPDLPPSRGGPRPCRLQSIAHHCPGKGWPLVV